MITTVIFDFDGTLADTNQIIINSFKHTYDAFGMKCDVEHILSTFGEPLMTTMNRDFSEHKIEDVLKCYRDYQINRFNDEVCLYDTVIETLKYLKEKNIKIAVVTSRMRQSTIDALKKFNIDSYFDVVVSADDTVNHKPHKEPLIKAINELNSSPSETYYIGDSKFDMECAINAKAIPVLVGWQKNSDELVKKYNIKYVLNRMWDLTKLV
nr:HAD-IA family hydrolase [Sedimentibacter sp.]